MSNDDILAKQVEYYRLRASEYDITAYGDLAESVERIDRIVADLAPSGSILELNAKKSPSRWKPRLSRCAVLMDGPFDKAKHSTL